MSKEIELKPCPFCGGHAISETRIYPTTTLHWITCESLACWFSQGAAGNTIEQAAEKWNRRTNAWIPAETPPERDPDDDGDHSKQILIYGTDEMMFLGYYDTFHKVYWDSDTCRATENAVCWMPLPEPPEI